MTSHVFSILFLIIATIVVVILFRKLLKVGEYPASDWMRKLQQNRHLDEFEEE